MSEFSPAVTIILDQLQANPDDFFGPLDSSLSYPKFNEIRKELSALATGALPKGEDHMPLWFLTEEERAALVDAYCHARRLRFDAEVTHKLLAPDMYKTPHVYAQKIGSQYGTALNTVTAAEGALDAHSYVLHKSVGATE